MIRRFEDSFQYESFEDCVNDVKARYRRTHRSETEGLHYQFNVSRDVSGRSGFVKVERLENSETAPNAQTESVLIDDNRIVSHQTEEPLPNGVELWRWLE